MALPLPPLSGPCPIKGESDFPKGDASGRISYVDWMVCQGDMTTHIADANFVFSEIEGSPGTYKGDITAYRNSTFFYYYQIENPAFLNSATLSTLSLDLDPFLIASAGYILGVDLDTGLTNPATALAELHNLPGEYEDAGASLSTPNTSSFDDTSVPQNQTWTFSPEIPLGDESILLFLSCYFPPMYSPATILNGATGYNGQLPVPTFSTIQIPESTSMLMLLSSIITFIFIRRKK